VTFATGFQARMIDGILILDKPAGLSSARAVAGIKRLLPRPTKVGHAGTLDPFATGVLLILIGKATRLCESLMNLPKSYQAVLRLGATTETDDLDSTPLVTPDPQPPSRQQFVEAADSFIGTIQQRPPAYSALKIGGRRAYDLARSGQTVELAPRAVRVDAIRIDSYQWPTATLSVDCGRGFYVRALARDLGEKLGVGGYLTALRRTAIGPYRDQDAMALDQATLDSITARILPAAAAGPPRPRNE
jgi:tRNA pseudouridine55 synthase